MWLSLIIVGIVVRGAQAFLAPMSPLLWGGSSQKFVLAPRSLLKSIGVVSPQKLTLWARPSDMSPTKLPQFRAKDDNTIATDAMGYQLCIEAGGDKSEDEVRINLCTGGPYQLWNVLPLGSEGKALLQLRGSDQCIGVQEDGSNEVRIQLLDCEVTAAEIWKFDGTFADPSFTGSPALIRHVIFSCIALVVALGGLSLASRFWRGRTKAMAIMPDHVPLSVEESGGVAMIPPKTFQLCTQPFAPNLDAMAPAVMAMAPAVLAPPTTVVVPKFGGGGGGGGGGISGDGGDGSEGGGGGGGGAPRRLTFFDPWQKATIVEDWLAQTKVCKMSADNGSPELAMAHARAEEALKELAQFTPSTTVTRSGIHIPHDNLISGVKLVIGLIEAGERNPGEIGTVLHLATATVCFGQLQISAMVMRPEELLKPNSTVSKDMEDGLENYAEEMGIRLVYALPPGDSQLLTKAQV